MRVIWPLLFLPAMAQGESLVATRPIAAGSVLQPSDMTQVKAQIPGALTDMSMAVGQSARRVIYPGRAILATDVGPPLLVSRNAVVELRYRSGSLHITASGRALDKGSEGEVIRVMSLESKSVVQGRIVADGSVVVGVP